MHKHNFQINVRRFFAEMTKRIQIFFFYVWIKRMNIKYPLITIYNAYVFMSLNFIFYFILLVCNFVC